jgi:Transcription-silencing protein Clr2
MKTPKRPAQPILPHSHDGREDAPRVGKEGGSLVDQRQLYINHLMNKGATNRNYTAYGDIFFHLSRAEISRSLPLIQDQQSWVPRLGEFVLMCIENPDSTAKQTWHGCVVMESPNEKREGFPNIYKDEPFTTDDLSVNTSKKHAVAARGFTVQGFDWPLRPDHEKRSYYFSKVVPLHHLRPLHYVEETLDATSMSEWQDTIKACLSMSAVFATYGCPSRIYGKGSEINFTYEGIWVGPELYIVGDAVRFVNRFDVEDGMGIVDVMVIEQIREHHSNFNDPEADRHFELVGTTYITIASNSETDNPPPVNNDTLPQGMVGRKWFRKTDKGTKETISIFCTFGRMHERAALRAWGSSSGNIAAGMASIQRFREQDFQAHKIMGFQPWIQEPSRVEALRLPETIASQAVFAKDLQDGLDLFTKQNGGVIREDFLTYLDNRVETGKSTPLEAISAQRDTPPPHEVAGPPTPMRRSLLAGGTVSRSATPAESKRRSLGALTRADPDITITGSQRRSPPKSQDERGPEFIATGSSKRRRQAQSATGQNDTGKMDDYQAMLDAIPDEADDTLQGWN